MNRDAIKKLWESYAWFNTMSEAEGYVHTLIKSIYLSELIMFNDSEGFKNFAKENSDFDDELRDLIIFMMMAYGERRYHQCEQQVEHLKDLIGYA